MGESLERYCVETTSKLVGIVLAGGESRRMGRDKGSARYRGEALVSRAYRLLRGLLPEVYVSLREEQGALQPYRGLPRIIDDGQLSGPAAGLVASWAAHPNAALCVLAADMPWVDEAMLEQLLESRDLRALATAFVHPDGVPEPLCTIWEPTALTRVPEASGSGGISLRRLLEQGPACLISPRQPERLRSINTPEDLRRPAPS